MTLSIADVRQANPMYFSKENTKFSGDISCRVLHDKQRQPYLVRLTHQGEHWFDSEHIAHWVINPIGTNLEVLPVPSWSRRRNNLCSFHTAGFATLADVKKALSDRFVLCYNCEYLTENWEILEGQNPVAQLCDDCLEKEKQNE